jgi:hypothetical protein
MANNFVFVSPDVKFSETDLTLVSTQLGITTLGMVGEAPKGAAFEPIFITSKGDMATRFGSLSNDKIGNNLKYPGLYYANSYLEESNQMYFVRVLGLSGYDAGTGWAITLSANIDPTTTGITTTTTGTTSFTGGSYLDVAVPTTTGETVTVSPEFIKVGLTSFTGVQTTFEMLTITGDSGTVQFTANTITGSSYTEYENMVLAVVRSRGTYSLNNLQYSTTGVTMSDSGASTNMLGQFVLNASGANLSANYLCSMDSQSRDFIPNVIGSSAKDRNTGLFIEAVYPDLIQKLYNEGYGYGINMTLVQLTANTFTDYATSYKTPETPWVVSELRGNTVERLFKFISISDGDSANREIKITIANIDPNNREFDVVIRDFNDTDENPILLESYRRCSMNTSLNTFIGKRIGTSDGEYAIQSKYVYLELNTDASFDTIACGFEGYNLRSYNTTNTGTVSATTPTIFYKTTYTDSDKLKKTFLGISEKGYSTTTYNGKSINQNLFNFNGAVTTSTSYIKTKGFHMDSGATDVYTVGNTNIGEFVVGEGQLRDFNDISSSIQPYYDRNSRKFTLVPYGGFDGWDIYRDSRTNTDNFKIGKPLYFADSDYYAYLAGINKYSNSEETVMNLFATPGINWSDNLLLVNETIEMVEEERGDCFYVIDAPDLEDSETLSQDIADLLDTTEIDTSYASTYYPWIQMNDPVNGVNLYMPPTGEVLKAFAYTDKIKAPWWANAGVSRGTTNARRPRRRLSLTERDTLYAGRINSLPQFSDAGVVIFGQKTLQVKDSALDRVNVRRLLLTIRKQISTIARNLLFDQNDDILIDEFLGKVNPILQNIKRERGIFDFKIEYRSVNTPETRERNELYFKLYVKPTPALEYVGVEMIVTPLGASFEQI